MREQMAKLGLSFEFVDATDERKGLTREEAGLLGEDDISKHKRHLMPGALGCLISHLRCYKKLLASPYPRAMIVEDDAHFGENFLQVLSCIVNCPHDWDLLRLGYWTGNEVRPWLGRKIYPLNILRSRKIFPRNLTKPREYYLGPAAFNLFGTHFYFISRNGCGFFLANHKGGHLPLDYLMCQPGAIRVHAVNPPIAWQVPGTGNIGYPRRIGESENNHKEASSGDMSQNRLKELYLMVRTKPLNFYRGLRSTLRSFIRG